MALDLSPTFEELGSHCPGSRGCRQPLPACFASRGLAQGPGQVPVSILGLLASCLFETPSAQQSRCAYSDLPQILPPCLRAHPPIRADQAPSRPWRLFPFPHLSWGGGVSLSLDGSFQRGSPSSPSQVLFLLICSPDNLLYPVALSPPIRTQITSKSLVLVSFLLHSGPVLKLVNQPERLS